MLADMPSTDPLALAAPPAVALEAANSDASCSAFCRSMIALQVAIAPLFLWSASIHGLTRTRANLDGGTMCTRYWPCTALCAASAAILPRFAPVSTGREAADATVLATPWEMTEAVCGVAGSCRLPR